jgi:colanic acid biosynthesis glycosyl transferase WcaI
MKNLLLHTIAFSPDRVSTAYLYNDIVLKFQKKGFHVSVVTTTPHFNPEKAHNLDQPLSSKFFGLFYLSDFNGINVIHVPQIKFKNTILRLVGFVYWHILSSLLILAQKNIDIILSPSPPLTIGFLNIVLAKIKNAKVIYNIQEVYPDLLIDDHSLTNPLGIGFLRVMERFIYNKSDSVTTIDEVFYDKVLPRFREKRKLRIIPNFVDTTIFKPLENSDMIIDNTIFPENDLLKVMFAGNIGIAQDWELLISVASELRDSKIAFFVVGDGVQKSHLQSEIRRKKINNIYLVPYQNRLIMPSLIAYSDLQFIFMSQKTEAHGFPSKIYTIMACGKPMLVASGNDTPISKFLMDKHCAFLVTEKKFSAKVAKVVSILRTLDKRMLVEYGQRAHEIVHREYSSDAVTNMYIELVDAELV